MNAQNLAKVDFPAPGRPMRSKKHLDEDGIFADCLVSPFDLYEVEPSACCPICSFSFSNSFCASAAFFS